MYRSVAEERERQRISSDRQDFKREQKYRKNICEDFGARHRTNNPFLVTVNFGGNDGER